MFISQTSCSGFNKLGNQSRPAFIGLGHEMAHIQDKWSDGFIDTSDWYGGKIADQYATHVENQIRAEHGITLRTHYGANEENGVITGPNSNTRIIDSSGRSIYYNTYYYYSIKLGNHIVRTIWNH